MNKNQRKKTNISKITYNLKYTKWYEDFKTNLLMKNQLLKITFLQIKKEKIQSFLQNAKKII